MKNQLFALAFILSASAHADLLTLAPGTANISGVNISTGATAVVDGKTINLTTVGAGLRKKVVLFKVDVYVAQLMVDDATRFVKSDAGALPSLENVGAVALRMDFKFRDVPAAKMSTAFEDGFRANGVDTKSTALGDFLAKVNAAGDAKQGGALTILITRNADGSTKVQYENLKNGTSTVEVIAGVKQTLHDILAIWLGVPSDKELGDLKAQILK